MQKKKMPFLPKKMRGTFVTNCENITLDLTLKKLNILFLGHYQNIPCEKDGWMTCDFTAFSTVFQSYKDDGQMILKVCVQ